MAQANEKAEKMDAEEMATNYALERSPTVQCPVCGEYSFWPHHKEDWLEGFRAAEAGMKEDEEEFLKNCACAWLNARNSVLSIPN